MTLHGSSGMRANTRAWTLERPVGERERGDLFLGYRNAGEQAFHRVACVSPFRPNESFARWIVDALNEREQREADAQMHPNGVAIPFGAWDTEPERVR